MERPKKYSREIWVNDNNQKNAVVIVLVVATLLTAILLTTEYIGCGFINIATCNFGI